MPCPQNDWATQHTTVGAVQAMPSNPVADLASPVLVVSNAPETLLPGIEDPATLYKCSIPMQAGASRRVRIFFWHLNTTNASKTLAIVTSIDQAANYELRDYQHDSFVPSGDNLAPSGICIAKAHLYGAIGQQSNLQRTSAETVLWQINVPNGMAVCALHEFTFTCPVATALRVRTVATSGSMGSFGDATSAAGAHIRGWWPKSQLTLSGNSVPFDLNPFGGGPEYIHCGICELGGPEVSAAGFGWQNVLIDPSGTPDGNKGAYGANLKYAFSVVNSDITQHQLWVAVRTRNSGIPPDPARYWGAGRVQGHAARGVPVIRWAWPPPPFIDPGTPVPDMVEPVSSQINIGTTPISQAVSVVVEIANGGAANLPPNIILGRSAVAVGTPEEPPIG